MIPKPYLIAEIKINHSGYAKKLIYCSKLANLIQ